MKITIATIGTQGDVQPYVALGIGLKEAGHDVSLATASNYEDFVTQHGLKFVPLKVDIYKMLQEFSAANPNVSAFTALCMFIRRMKEVIVPWRKYSCECVSQIAASTDVLIINTFIYHYFIWSGIPLPGNNKIPCFVVSPHPDISPTRKFPSFRITTVNLGGMLNRMSYWWADYGDYILNRILFPPPKISKSAYRNIFRRHSVLGELARHSQAYPVLYCYSKQCAPVPDDSKTASVVTGYWFLNSPSEYRPSDALVNFLNKGEPPVYVGFSSMIAIHPEEVTQIIIEALVRVKKRGLISFGWGGLAELKNVPDSVMMTRSIPHAWIFPRVQAIVHHGGAGTTSEAIRSGKPEMVCYFGWDQLFWGNQVYRLGVGPRPIDYKKLTVKKLAAAIQRMTSDAHMQQRAQELAGKIRSEDGVGNAVNLISRLLSQ